MNLLLIDAYVIFILTSNGWTEERNFVMANDWIRRIEKSGVQCFPYAQEILCSVGGMKIREPSPKSCQIFLDKCGRDFNKLDKWYQRPLIILENLQENTPINKYNGATFTFDALYAFQDQELVMDFRLVETQIGEKLFPIGTVEPDGISYASESKKIYTLFKDSAFLSGDCIENYLNMLFLHEYKPQQII